MMTLEQAKKLKVGDKLRVLVDGRGGVDEGPEGEVERAFHAGEIVEVAHLNTFRPPQNFAVTVFSTNFVVNVFDEADFGGLYPFAVPLNPGDRVRLTKPVDNFPTGFFEAGLTGTLQRIDDEGAYWVKLDKVFPALAEWNNEVQIWDWSHFSDNGPEHHPAAYLAPAGD